MPNITVTDSKSLVQFALHWTLAAFFAFFGYKLAQIVYAAIPWP